MPTVLPTVAQLALFTQQAIPANDPAATLMLQIAFGMVQDELMQALVEKTETVLLDPGESGYVRLPEFPVTAVSLVETFDGTAWSTATVASYTLSKRLGLIVGQSGYSWPIRPESWRVTYTHGFATLPDTLIGVVLGVAARAYISPVSVESERIGGYQVKYAMESGGFSAIELRALDRYRVARSA